MSGEEKTNTGVSLTRTYIPTLPPGYLSRKHLYPLLDNSAPGSTLVIAPAGYGKSALVAQWARERKTIWITVTEGDSLNEMAAMLIQATQNVIPEFGSWFEKEQPLRLSEVIRRWGNEIQQSKEKFVFVLDNLRSENSEDADHEGRFIELLPSNVHFVAIHRNAIDNIYSICSSRGPLKVLTARELRFSEKEIISLARSAGIAINPKNEKLLSIGQGWPSATSLIVEHINHQRDELDIAALMSSETEPLRQLALFVINELDPNVVKTAEVLSFRDVFDLNIAKYLLEQDYSSNLISAIAMKGEIFSPSGVDNQSYVFSPLIREILQERINSRPSETARIQGRLIEYFEKGGNITLAIEHAFQSGDSKKISELFPTAARMKQAQGMGGDLMRWSVYAAIDPDEGYQKGLTLRIVSLLASLDCANAKIENDRLEIAAHSSGNPEFYLQFVAGVRAYVDICAGNFLSVEAEVHRALESGATCYLGVDDQINLLRTLVSRFYIADENKKVEEVANKARLLLSQTQLDTSHTFILSIEAMDLHQRGEYRKAHEMATMAIAQCRRHGFVGMHGPLDAMYVKARCLLEFSRAPEAISLLEEIRELAFQWKQWHWYFAVDNHLIQDLCLSGRHKMAIEHIRAGRELVATFDFSHSLNDIIDVNEMFIRKELKDYDRLEKLLKRAPNVRHAQHMRMLLNEQHHGRDIVIDVSKLPEDTPRDLIWKYLNEVSLNIESENIALLSMHKAMKVAAAVGAKETFLRQNDDLGNLILKIASEDPTVYNEDLANSMAIRMRDRGRKMDDNRPPLTKRELEILRQLSTGRTLSVIASELHISQNTMKTHLKNLYRKMKVEGRKEAVDKAASLFLL